jgi:hypothetical protein
LVQWNRDYFGDHTPEKCFGKENFRKVQKKFQRVGGQVFFVFRSDDLIAKNPLPDGANSFLFFRYAITFRSLRSGGVGEVAGRACPLEHWFRTTVEPVTMQSYAELCRKLCRNIDSIGEPIKFENQGFGQAPGQG